ncbi:MAG: WecB/TagA/CpsF family glycosyltransferase [Treponema sp.]
MAITRINLLTVPLDILPDEDIEQTVMGLLEKPGTQHIVFLTVWDLLKARRNTEFRAMIDQAALCLPLSKSLLRAARFLKLPVPVRRDSFDMIIRVLNVIDSHYKSLYLLGGRAQSLLEAERNVRITFPGISIVGRFNGFYRKTMEADIILSIVKAHPALLLIANGIPGDSLWVYRNREKLPAGIVIHNNDIIDIFSKRKKRISDSAFRKGCEIWPQILRNPFKIFSFFRYLLFLLIVVFYRLFRKNPLPPDGLEG